MVIFVIDALGVFVGKRECHAPTAAHFHGPGALSLPLKFVESQPGQIHISGGRRRVQRAEDQSQSLLVFGLDPAFAPSGEELLESFVPKPLDRHSRECNLWRYGSQSSYSADRYEPPHIHVEREGSRAKFWLTPVRLARSGGFGASELLRLERLVNERQSLLLGAWDEYFTATE